jgi:hypothetical protein
MSEWPDDLPIPLVEGFEISRGPLGRRFEVDVGPAEQDMTTTAALYRVSLLYECTSSEMGSILSFHADPAGGAGGGAWFTFTQPWTGVTLNARFVVGSEPRAVPSPPNFNVSVTLEVDGW